MKVLFIAKNIPRPSTKTNKIIYSIAENLSEFCSISFLRPREFIPFWLKHNKKFSDLYGLKGWRYNSFNIITYPYIQLPFKKAKYWMFTRLSQLGKSFIANNNFDLVHAHYLLPDGYIAYRIYRKYDIPYIITFRNQDKQYLKIISPNNPDYRKAKKIIANAKTVLTPNGGYKEFVESRFNVDCKIMPHGIEKEVFKQKSQIEKDNKITILSVADKLPTKNVEWVINAFNAYNGIKEINLQLVGDVCNREEIITLTCEDHRIELLGKVKRDKVLELMRESDIFALPSSKETFGLVYLEAAATHNAIIGYKGEGVWGVFEENVEMLFCSDYDEFQFQLFNLIENNKARTKLQQNVFEKAKTMQWQEITRTYEDIYMSAITQKPKG